MRAVVHQDRHGRGPDGEHGAVMIPPVDPSAVPNLSTRVTYEDLPGDAW